MTATTDPDNLILVPYGSDPLASLSERLLKDHRDTLPRLEQVTVLLPDLEAAPRLRRVLLEQAEELGHSALLGPAITTWRTWVSAQNGESVEVVSNHRRELILVEALREHPTLFGEGNLWALADSLLALFDELTLNRVGLPRDLESFSRLVGQGYGTEGLTLDGLEREARLVHTLWHAWHQELQDRRLIDHNTHYLLQLAATLHSPVDGPLYLVGPASMNAAELAWVAQMVAHRSITLILHGQISSPPSRAYHPEAPLHRITTALQASCSGTEQQTSSFSRLLDQVFNPSAESDTPLRLRARLFSRQEPHSPATGRLQLLAADGNEEEAHAVELQVRRWLLEGKRHIGIVTENRRLARRVRALLERAGIHLQDAAGWALSTTSAAAVLERWLECVEEDFSHLAMLDLLKSPFFASELPAEDHLNRVYRLERDLIQRENISAGMHRYRQHLHYRQQRLPQTLAEHLQGVDELLVRLEEASARLLPVITAVGSSANAIIEALQQSLQSLGLEQTLTADAAGMRILEEFDQMQQAVIAEPVQMSWLEFRSWLGRTLERFHFRPPSSGHAVSLMGLGQTCLAHFDALIIAGVEREHLPGTPSTPPFFNNGVRRQLGLPGSDDQLAERLHHFRRLLESAPQILLTFRHHQNGEEVAPSPWLEALRAFHQLAYHDDLIARELAELVRHPLTQVANREAALPAPTLRPAPSLPQALLPSRYSASAYQQLMDCPYQFYAARGLSLAPPETVREALEKSDYGERVHRCLQAFHGEINDLPGPFNGRLTAARRDEAEALLRRISQAVFATDLEDNFLHRGWLQRWLEKLPAYLDWQIDRESLWQVAAVEVQAQRSMPSASITLQGRLDRIDSNGVQRAIVDYKTGHIPDRDEVESGEAVQLPFYALLAEEERAISEVAYLALDQDKVKEKTPLQDEELHELSQAVGERLAALVEEMHGGARFPAWGDERSCGYCPMTGICRRQSWHEETEEHKKGGLIA